MTSFLPPVIAELRANVAGFLSGMTEAQTAMKETDAQSQAMADAVVASNEKVAASMAEMSRMTGENALAAGAGPMAGSEASVLAGDTAVAGGAAADAAATEANAAAHERAAVAKATDAEKANSLGGALGALGGPTQLGIAAVVGFGLESLKAASSFETLTTQIVTGAGESQSNLELIRSGLMAMAPAVGITADELAKGLYNIESAGYRGQQGLDVLKAAAEGAAVGGAQMATVADGLTTAMNSYRGSGMSATQMTNDLIATVAAGKMHMEDLAGSLGHVLPAASVAHLSLQQVTAAMATMTAEGTPAADAATYLRQTILQLSNPSAKAVTEMTNLGLSAIDVSQHLGQRGLTGTLDILTTAIQSRMGPAGTVLIEQLKASANNQAAWDAALSKASPTQQTYIAALADMVGGTKSMQAALELTGSGASVFAGNVKTITDASHQATDQVNGFSLVQQDLGFQTDSANASFHNLLITLGDNLAPIARDLTTAFATIAPPLEKFIPLMVTLAKIDLAPVLLPLKFAGDLAGPLNKLGDAAQWLNDAIGRLSDVAGGKITEFADSKVGPALDRAKGYFGGFASAVPQAMDDLWRGVQSVGGQVAGFFTSLPGRITSAVAAFPGLLLQAGKDLLGGLLTGVKSVFDGDLASWFQSIDNRLMSYFGDAARWLFQAGKDVITGLFRGVTDAWPTVEGWFRNLPGQFGAFVSTADRWLFAAGENVLIGLWNGIASWTGKLWDALKSIPNGMGIFFSNAPTWLYDIGKDIIGGLWDGIVDGVKSGMNKLGGIKDGIVGGIKSIFRSSSPSRVMHEEVGLDLGAGIVSGLLEGVGRLNGSQMLSSVLSQTDVGTGASGGAIGTSLGGGGVTLNVQPGAIVIHGAQEPEATAEAVRQRLVTWARQQGIKSLFGAYA